jgi:hypothetical protein
MKCVNFLSFLEQTIDSGTLNTGQQHQMIFSCYGSVAGRLYYLLERLGDVLVANLRPGCVMAKPI